MKQCDICNQEYKGNTCVIFIPGEYDWKFGGYNLFVCIECFMSYLAYLGMTNREITEWLNWSYDNGN